MNIRTKGLAWFSKHFGEMPNYLHVSRFYPATLSFTKQAAWAFEIPPREIHGWGFPDVFLVYQVADGDDDFGCIRVPAVALQACLHHLYVRSDNNHISLFLSAEKEDRLREQRGKGAIEFGPFAWNGQPAI